MLRNGLLLCELRLRWLLLLLCVLRLRVPPLWKRSCLLWGRNWLLRCLLALQYLLMLTMYIRLSRPLFKLQLQLLRPQRLGLLLRCLCLGLLLLHILWMLLCTLHC